MISHQTQNMTGLKTIPSAFSVRETIDRLAAVVESNGLNVFARIDHAANAGKAGMTTAASGNSDS